MATTEEDEDNSAEVVRRNDVTGNTYQQLKTLNAGDTFRSVGGKCGKLESKGTTGQYTIVVWDGQTEGISIAPSLPVTLLKKAEKPVEVEVPPVVLTEYQQEAVAAIVEKFPDGCTVFVDATTVQDGGHHTPTPELIEALNKVPEFIETVMAVETVAPVVETVAPVVETVAPVVETVAPVVETVAVQPPTVVTTPVKPTTLKELWHPMIEAGERDAIAFWKAARLHFPDSAAAKSLTSCTNQLGVMRAQFKKLPKVSK